MDPANLTEKHKLIPWLLGQLRQGLGAEWVRPEEGLFRVSWPRVNKNSDPYGPEFQFFRSWAEHNGIYVPGRGEPNLRQCKDNIRSAFRKSEFIINAEDPEDQEDFRKYNYYRLEGLDLTVTRLDADPQPSISDQQVLLPNFDAFIPSSPEQQPQQQVQQEAQDQQLLQQQQILPLQMEDDNSMLVDDNDGQLSLSQMIESLDSSSFQLDSFSLDSLLGSPSAPEQEESPPSVVIPEAVPIDDQGGQALNGTASLNLDQDLEDDEACSMRIMIKYCGVIVDDKIVSNQNGCHMYYSEKDENKHQKSSSLFSPERADQLYGTSGADLIPMKKFYIPQQARSVQDHAATADKGQQRLARMARGLRFECEGGSLYVTRYCKAKILYMSQNTFGEILPISRERDDSMVPSDTRTKVFDFPQYAELLNSYRTNPFSFRPIPYVYLACAQEFSSCLRIQIVVASQRALDALKEMEPDALDDRHLLDFSHLQNNGSGVCLASRTDTRDNDAKLVDDLSNMKLF